MLYLYPKNAVDFTNNGDPIRHSFDEHVIRDDGFYLTFNLLLDKEEEYKKVKKEMIVAAETPDGRNQFRVYDVKKKSTQVEIIAVQLMYDFDNKEVNPFSVKNASGNQVISRFKNSFKSTLGQFTMDSSVTELHDFTTNEEEDDTPSHNALETLNRITKRWDSELMLNGFDIRMIKRLGSKTDALLYEKKNISEFEDASSVSGMATRIHATSKFTPEGKEDEVTLSVTVDSPLINEYAQIYEKSYVNNDAKTEVDLIAWVKLKYSTENIDKPSRTITVETNIIDGTEINYGDDLVMKYLVHDVDEVIRCVGYDYDPIKNTYYSVTLGDWKDSFATTLTGGIIDTTNRQLNQIKNNITYISMSANGKNRNAYGPDPVPNPINGDQWFYYELDRPDDVEYRVYQDGFWVKLDFFATKKEVEDVIDQADADREATEQKLDQAVADAKAYTEKKANEFDTKFETETGAIRNEVAAGYTNAITVGKDYTDVKSAEFDAQLIVVKNDLVNTVLKADAAVLKADKAIEDAGFMKVEVDAAKTNAIDALTAANAAKVDSASALTKANTAITDSSKALTNANSALTRVGSVEVTTGELSTSYDALTRTVGLKADQTTVDGIKGTVTTQGLTISANATAIGLKADKSVVDTINGTVTKHTADIKANSDGLKLKADSSIVSTLSGTVATHTTQIKAASDGLELKADSMLVNTIKGTVDTHTTQIKATSDGLALKADSTLVNAIKGTVDSHSTQISANSTAISARLTSTQVDSLVSAKGYVNQTTLDATAKGLKANITQVSSDLDSLEIGGRNLLAGTSSFTGEWGNKGNWVVQSYKYKELTVYSRSSAWGGLYKAYAVEKGAVYTFSLYAKTDVEAKGIIYLLTVGGVPSAPLLPENLPCALNDDFKKVSITFKALDDGVIHPRMEMAIDGVKLSVAGYKLEKGTKATDWSPAPEDMATLEKVTSIEATVNGIQTTVGNKADKSLITQLAGQISSKVESETYNSKMTQLDKAINLRVESGKLMSQLNLNPEGILLQGKNILLDGNVTMATAFVETIKAKSLDAVYADIATLKTKVLTADVITSVHLKVDNALIDKMTANVAVIDYLFTKKAIIDNVEVKSLSAIYADIATLKTKLLTADVITSVHIKSDTALIDKLFVTDANINRLTAKSAFINSVKAIDIAADRITTGILNAAKVTIINLDASRITTGTITGANSDWNLNTGIQTFRNPSTGDNLILSQGAIQFQNGGQVRLLEYTAEGLKLSAGPGNTGTSLNASLHLNGGVSYVQFNNRAGTVNNGRIQMTSDSATIQIPNGAFLAIRDRNNLQAGISVNYVTTEHNTGYTIQMAGDSIKTPRAGNRNIYIAPNGTGSVVAGEASGTRYNMVASDFVKQSSISTKTNIIPLESGLDNIRQLKPVSYNKIDKLNQGIFEIEKGFIAEDSLMVATVDGKGIYDSHITAYLVKAVQELDVRTISETDLLKEKVRILEEKIQKLESAA